jgi:hypothetical protein
MITILYIIDVELKSLENQQSLLELNPGEKQYSII